MQSAFALEARADLLPVQPGLLRHVAQCQHHAFLHALEPADVEVRAQEHGDRKSTRLNSSHTVISYAVFCLKKKNTHCVCGADVVRPSALAITDTTGKRAYSEKCTLTGITSSPCGRNHISCCNRSKPERTY